MQEFNFNAPIHKSLTRPQMIMGCDRELYLTLVLFSTILIGPTGLFDGRFAPAILGVIFWLCGTFGLSQMAKNDSHARQVFLRALRYKEFYPATGYTYEEEPPLARW